MILFYLFAYLVGYYRIETDSPAKVANLLANRAISVFGLSASRGKVTFFVLLLQKKKTVETLRRYAVSVSEISFFGLPAFFYRHRFRVGAMLGIACAILLTVFSGRFIWQIDVVGNKVMSDEEVLSLLADEGVYEGAYIGSFDPLSVANRCVMASDTVSWMGVNIIGNSVEVVVVEYTPKDVIEKETAPSNVVAKKNGVVRRVVLTSGVAAVKEGTVVTEGTLLISGVNQLRNEKYHYQPAKGQVYAETLNEITVEKSVNSEEKVYTGEVFYEKGFIFFTKAKKFTQDSRYLSYSYDRIEFKERVMLFGMIPLPIWITRVEYRAFQILPKQLSEEEAREAALAEAYAKLAEGELVSLEESYTFEEGVARVTLRYRVVEDIAKDLPLFETP